MLTRASTEYTHQRPLESWRDQVEGEGWVDKNAALRGWVFFTSYMCKLKKKPFSSLKVGHKK